MVPTTRRAAFALLAAAVAVVGCDSERMYPADVENLTEVATEAAFEEQVLKAEGAVLVDFYATWCGPCRMVVPAITRLAPLYAGKAAFVVVDVDKASGLAGKHKIRSIPTLVVFAGGKEVKRMVGVHDEAAIRAALDAAVSP